MSLDVDLQIVPRRFDWPCLREQAQAAEAHGYRALWVLDHLAGNAMDSDGMFECFAWLGALAAVTERIELGSLVVNVWNRNPGTTVAAAATVASIAGRRLLFGVGAGTSPHSRYAWEQDRTGARVEPDIELRHTRVRDVLALAAELWSGDGETFQRPAHRPLTVVGVNTRRLARLAAVHADGLNVWWDHPRRDAIVDAARAACTPGKPFELSTWRTWQPALLDPDHPERRAMARAGFARIILATRALPIR